MKTTFWSIGIALAILAIDSAIGFYLEYRKRRDAYIERKTLERYNMGGGAFKPVTKDWRSM